MPTVNDIVEMEQAFLRKHGNRPTKLHLTLDDELDLILSVCYHLSEQTVEEITSSGRLKGLLPQIHGMDVIYESEKTYLE